MRKANDTVQLKLRFDERLRRRLERAAEKADRSMNAEILHRLEQSFENDDFRPVLIAMADELSRRGRVIAASVA